jgi:L,D-transpeptidase catalytic domain/Putative peptidoglycan binding domain
MLALAAAYFYTRSQRAMLAGGIRVGTIDLGGLSSAAARIKLAKAYRPLTRPLVLRYRDGRVVLTAREARVSVDTGALVDRALALSHRGGFLARAWRELTGGQVQATLSPRVHYSRSAVEHTVRVLQHRIDRPPLDAVLVPSFDRLTIKGGHRGVAVAAGLLRREIATSLVAPQAWRLLAVPLRRPRPRVTVAVLRRRYPSFITIDRARFRLRLYRHLRPLRSYPIAVGQVGLQTPAGLYHIQDRAVNPSWQVPFSAWTGSLAGRLIPPGPDDPLKARWLGIFNGAGIHGTDETWSIGHAVSHGCVRMTIPDVIDLYNRVRVGAPVYIGD